jgi:type IV pilus assembly protein PilN
MIRINLLPVREIQAEVGRRQEQTVAGLSVGATLLLVLVVYLFQAFRLSQLNGELENFQKEIAILDVQAKGVAELQQKIADLRGKVKAIDELNQKKTGPVRMMEGLTTATPGRLWLIEFKESGGDLALTGMAVDNQTVAEFLKALAGLPYFRNVELVETTQSEQGGAPLKKFSIRANVVYQPVQTSVPPEGKKG